MKTAVFKSTGAIIVYSLVAIGLLAIAGYNWLGWFGGSDAWKENQIRKKLEAEENENLNEIGDENTERGRILGDNLDTRKQKKCCCAVSATVKNGVIVITCDGKSKACCDKDGALRVQYE